MPICYSSTHVPSRKQYIGVTCNGLERRKSQHLAQAKRGEGSIFQLALLSFDADQFEWKVEGEGSKDEMHRLESRLISERGTIWPSGLNRHWVDYEARDSWNAWMEEIERDPGYIHFKNDIDDFLLKTEIAYASENPDQYENLEDWEIDHKTNSLVRRDSRSAPSNISPKQESGGGH